MMAFHGGAHYNDNIKKNYGKNGKIGYSITFITGSLSGCTSISSSPYRQ